MATLRAWHGKDFTEEQWKKIKPPLPSQPRVSRRRVDDPTVVAGIPYVLPTGYRWQDMPRQYGA